MSSDQAIPLNSAVGVKDNTNIGLKNNLNNQQQAREVN